MLKNEDLYKEKIRDGRVFFETNILSKFMEFLVLFIILFLATYKYCDCTDAIFPLTVTFKKKMFKIT